MTISRSIAVLTLLVAASGCDPQAVPASPADKDTQPPVITVLTVSPARAGRQTAVEISFRVDELLEDAAVLVAGYAGDCARAVHGLVVCGYTTRGDEPSWAQQVVVRAVDLYGNAAEATGTLDLDYVAPTVTLLRAPAALVNQDSATVEFVADEPARFSCSLDSAPAVPCVSPYAVADLADGAHLVAIVARDEAGNEASVSFDFAVDTSVPETTLDAAPPALSNLESVRFEFSSNDPQATFACSLDRAVWDSCVSPLELSLADGDHELAVRAVDTAGNADTSPASAAFRLDRTAPVTTFGPIADDGLPERLVPFAADDAEASFECAFDRGPYEPCSSPVALSGLADGSYRVFVRASDAAGNLESPAAETTVVVDTTPPLVRFDSGPTETLAAASADFAFGADEPASFECSLDGADFAPCTSPASAAVVDDREHRFQVIGTDRYSNRSAPVSWQWRSDAFPPAVMFTASPAPLTNQRTAAFAWVANKPGCTFLCSLDGAPPVACGESRSFADLSDGPHRFSVTAVDARDRVGDPLEMGWTVDGVRPTVTIVRAPNALSNETPARFELSADEAGCSFECQLDGAAWASCGTPWELPVGEGNHVFSARALDPAGNLGDPATAFFETDLTPPAAPAIDQPDPSLVSDTTPGFTWSAAATAIGYRFELSATADFSQTVEQEDTASLWHVPSPLASGRYFFRVRGRDAAGNDSDWSATGMIEVRTWRFLNPTPQGATLWAAGCSSAERCIFVGEAGTALRTEDGGQTLVQAATGTGGLLTGLHRFDDANAVAVGAGGTILRTSDGGVTWWPVASGTRADLYAVRFRGQTGFAAGDGGMMLKSTDGGASWARQATGSTASVRDLAILDAAAQTVVAVGGAGAVLRTTDGGLGWSAPSSGVTDQLRSVSFVDAARGFAVGGRGVIRKTTDGGQSWGSVDPVSTQEVFGVAFTSAQVGYVVGDSTSALSSIRRTEDGGLGWANHNSPPGPSLRRIHFVPGTEVAWAVGEGGTILRSVDGGASFAPVAGTSGGPTQTINQELRAVEFLSPSVGYVFGGSGYARKTVDGGGTMLPLTSPVFTSTRDLYAASFLDEQNGWIGGSSSFLVRTTDGESFATVPTPAAITIRALHFADAQHGLIVGTGGKAMLWNGVEVVSLVSPTGSSLRAVKLAGPAAGFVVGDGGTVLRWDGSTLTAEESGVSEDLYGLWAFDATRAVAVGAKGRILRRSAAGWAPVASGTTLVLEEVAFANQNDGWAVGDGVILVTHDGGASWQPQLCPTGATLQSVSAPTSGAVFAAGGGRNLIRTSVGGR